MYPNVEEISYTHLNTTVNTALHVSLLAFVYEDAPFTG